MQFLCLLQRPVALMLFAIVAVADTALAAPPTVQPFSSAVGRELIDLPECRVFHDGTAAPADAPRLLRALGGAPPAQQPGARWSAGKVVGKDGSGESKDRSANGTSASVGRAGRIMRSNRRS